MSLRYTKLLEVQELPYQPLTHYLAQTGIGYWALIPGLFDHGHSLDSGAVTPIQNPTEFLSLKSTNICAKLFHNQDFGIGDFLRSMSLWYIYPVLIGWVTQLWLGNCLVFMSQLANQDVSYPHNMSLSAK